MFAAPNPSDRALIAQLIVIGVAAVVAVVLAGSYAEREILQAEAARKSECAAAFLRGNLLDLPGILATGRTVTDDLVMLRHASQGGEAFHYRLYDPQGRVMAASRRDDVGTRNASPCFNAVVREGQLFLGIGQPREAVAELDGLGRPDGEAARVVASRCEPVMEGSTLLGVIEVQLDMTPLHDRLGVFARAGFGGLLAMIALAGFASGAFLRRNARERRRSVERFEEARRGAEGLGRRVRGMFDDLVTAEEEKMRHLVSLADGISHELRSPLAILSMGLDAVEAFPRRSGDEDLDAPLADMREALGRVGGFVHHLAAVSIEHGRVGANVDVNETIRGLASLIQLDLRTSDPPIALDLSPSVAALSLPYQSVALSLFIIMNVAAEHVHESGEAVKIETRMHPGGDSLEVRIVMSGPPSEEAQPSTLGAPLPKWSHPSLDTASRVIESLGGELRVYPQAPGAQLCAALLPGVVRTEPPAFPNPGS